MKYYLVVDFGTKVECESRKDIPEALGYTSREEMIDDNGGAMPDICEITRGEYFDDDGYYVY